MECRCWWRSLLLHILLPVRFLNFWENRTTAKIWKDSTLTKVNPPVLSLHSSDLIRIFGIVQIKPGLNQNQKQCAGEPLEINGWITRKWDNGASINQKHSCGAPWHHSLTITAWRKQDGKPEQNKMNLCHVTAVLLVTFKILAPGTKSIGDWLLHCFKREGR